MNRQQRRSFKKKFKSFANKNPDTATALLSLANHSGGSLFGYELNPGDKVQLNLKTIHADPDFKKLTEKRRQFIEDNQGKMFTVEYDEDHTNHPIVVCFAEDQTDPKWLWYVGHLKKVGEAESEG